MSRDRPLTRRPEALVDQLGGIAAQRPPALIARFCSEGIDEIIDVQLELCIAALSAATNFGADGSSVPFAVLRHGRRWTADVAVPPFGAVSLNCLANDLLWCVRGRYRSCAPRTDLIGAEFALRAVGADLRDEAVLPSVCRESRLISTNSSQSFVRDLLVR